MLGLDESLLIEKWDCSIPIPCLISRIGTTKYSSPGKKIGRFFSEETAWFQKNDILTFKEAGILCSSAKHTEFPSGS